MIQSIRRNTIINSIGLTSVDAKAAISTSNAASSGISDDKLTSCITRFTIP